MPTSSSSHRHARPRAQAVTTAPRSGDEDRRRRMRNYLVAMLIRTACLPLAVWAFTSGRYAVAWVAALGAAFIPSFAVMIANAVDRRQQPVDASITSPVLGLGPGRQAADPGPEPGRAAKESPEAGTDAAVQGTVVSSRDTAYPAAGADLEDKPDGSGST